MSRILTSRIYRRPLSTQNSLRTTYTRNFSATRPTMVDIKDISPSPGENAEELATQTTNLVDNGLWQLWNGGKGLERQFKFKTFKATWVRSLAQHMV